MECFGSHPLSLYFALLLDELDVCVSKTELYWVKQYHIGSVNNELKVIFHEDTYRI